MSEWDKQFEHQGGYNVRNNGGIEYKPMQSQQNKIGDFSNINLFRKIGDNPNPKSDIQKGSDAAQGMEEAMTKLVPTNSKGNQAISEAFERKLDSKYEGHSRRSVQGELSDGNINTEGATGKKGIPLKQSILHPNADKENIEKAKNDYLKELGFSDEDMANMQTKYDNKTKSLYFQEQLIDGRVRYIKPQIDDKGNKSVLVTETKDGQEPKSVEIGIDKGAVATDKQQINAGKDQGRDLKEINKTVDGIKAKLDKDKNYKLSDNEMKKIAHELGDMEKKGYISSENAEQLNKLPSSIRQQVNEYINKEKEAGNQVPNFRFDETDNSAVREQKDKDKPEE